MSETSSVDLDADLDPRHVAGVVVGALVLALYASWMAADIVGRWLIFPVVALLTGYYLYLRDEPGDKGVFFGYSLAGMMVLTPILMVVPDLTGSFEGGTPAIGLANVVILVIFLIPAAIVAYVTYRYSGGTGVVERVRDRLDDSEGSGNATEEE